LINKVVDGIAGMFHGQNDTLHKYIDTKYFVNVYYAA
jgi:hypothetical protein